jgi:hypothetical protein
MREADSRALDAPRSLWPGGTVAVVSPSWGGPGTRSGGITEQYLLRIAASRRDWVIQGMDRYQDQASFAAAAASVRARDAIASAILPRWVRKRSGTS